MVRRALRSTIMWLNRTIHHTHTQMKRQSPDRARERGGGRRRSWALRAMQMTAELTSRTAAAHGACACKVAQISASDHAHAAIASSR